MGKKHKVNFDELRKTFNQVLIETLEHVNSTPRNHTGVWYYDDYASYCQETESEFNPDLKQGFANPEYWKRTGHFAFKLKKGAKPSEAIKAFINGFTVADCGNILIASQYAALLKVFGEEKFNLLFGSGCAPLIINKHIYDQQLNNPASYFFDVTDNDSAKVGTLGNRPVASGEFCNIKGVLFYLHKHPAGCVSSFNVTCVGINVKGEDVFLGFDPTTFKKPLTERELFDVFVYHYNLDRNEFDKEAAKTRQETFYPEKISTDTHFHLIKGFLPASRVRPNFALINEYSQLAESQVILHHCKAMAEIYRRSAPSTNRQEETLSTSSPAKPVEKTTSSTILPGITLFTSSGLSEREVTKPLMIGDLNYCKAMAEIYRGSAPSTNRLEETLSSSSPAKPVEKTTSSTILPGITLFTSSGLSEREVTKPITIGDLNLFFEHDKVCGWCLVITQGDVRKEWMCLTSKIAPELREASQLGVSHIISILEKNRGESSLRIAAMLKKEVSKPEKENSSSIPSDLLPCLHEEDNQLYFSFH